MVDVRVNSKGIKQVKHSTRWRKACIEENCMAAARSNSDKCKKHNGGVRCSEEGCETAAVDGRNKCKKHGGFPCSIVGCPNSARDSSGTCAAHGGGKRCSVDGCDKSSQGSTDFCISHNGGKRCDVEGCQNLARGGGKCIKHNGGKRCIIEGCPNGAIGGSDRCRSHNGGKWCIIEGCTKPAVNATSICYLHGGYGQCSEEGCTSHIREGSNKCAAHGGGKRCPNCIDWIDSRSSNPKYDGYCATCFKRLFPDDPKSKVIYEHTKEIAVRNFINAHFEGFIHDMPLYTGNCDCIHRRRVDHRKLIGNTILAIETDEFGHKYYDQKDEEIRYDDVYMIHSGKWIWIRFNPDDNMIEGKVDLEDKLEMLKEEMEHQIGRIEMELNEELVEIVKMYC